MDNEQIIKRLYSLQDMGYGDFHSALMPTVARERVIGIRIPELRKLAREIRKKGEYEDFLSSLPHYYYEENNLHAFIICLEKDIDKLFDYLDEFLPFVDNWATCDSIRPAVFKKHPEKVLVKVNEWINSPYEYAVRFGIEVLLVYFLGDNFDVSFAENVALVTRDEYSIEMVMAWYFATALSFHYDEIIPFIENKRLSVSVHNKTIQKAVDSKRISEEHKEKLKKMRIK